MKWQEVPRVDEGKMIEGDLTVPPTRRRNHWWLVLFGWKTIVTFQVPRDVAVSGYYIGFTNYHGKSYRTNKLQHDEFFSMKIGREDCLFWVRTTSGTRLLVPTLIGRGPLH